jgi:hypothetical protein
VTGREREEQEKMRKSEKIVKRRRIGDLDLEDNIRAVRCFH